MKLVLKGLKDLTWQTAPKPSPESGFIVLRVHYCAVCRTDAKMWNEGHRDLVFPRVPGHELIAADESGNRFVVWPGTTCGRCRYCRSGRENLCEEMKIMGFHHDGGFSDYLLAPRENLIPVPPELPSHIACFCEPVGCVLNALEKLSLKARDRMIIFGGGTLGVLIAIIAKDKGYRPTVIEKNAEKIEKLMDIFTHLDIPCVKETTESEFDASLTACPDPIAFSLGVAKLGKGGRFSFFSGLTKNEHIETNLLNLIHYKENQVHGAYGLTRAHMRDALPYLARHADLLGKLIEGIFPPSEAANIMPKVLGGDALKFILAFTPDEAAHAIGRNDLNSKKIPAGPIPPAPRSRRDLPGHIRARIPGIEPVSHHLRPAAQHKIDNKTKPLGALGTLESLAVQMSLIQGDLNPDIHRKLLLVFAGDHGITEEGVSAYPAEVTRQMVVNFLDGGAAINVLCRHNDIDLRIVDMGVNADFEDNPKLIKKKVRKSTRNFVLEPAMTAAEAHQAIRNGMDVFLKENARKKIDILGLGEMGIGNTTSATSIVCTVTGMPPTRATGRGTGVDDKGLEHKTAIIERALGHHRLDATNGIEILQKIGGFEIAGMVGAALAAASTRSAIVLDGVISTAAGLIAYLIEPAVGDYFIAGHKSVEISHQAALDHMGLLPLMDFNMRLGEGTGAAMAIEIVAAACRVMREMASFDEAGVSQKK